MMSKKNLIRTSALVSLVLVGAVALHKGGARRESSDLEPAKKITAAFEKETKTELLKEETPRRMPTESVSKTEFKNHPHAKDLESYTEIKSKVFLKDEERSLQEKLVKDERLVESLKEILLTPTKDFSPEMKMQNMALDLLFEAQRAGNPAAAEVMRHVISDQQVENNSLSPDSRKSLAGIKAEILYEWSAREPERIQEMRSWLPGPVSQKIWTNISKLQEQNLYQSALEKKSR